MRANKRKPFLGGLRSGRIDKLLFFLARICSSEIIQLFSNANGTCWYSIKRVYEVAITDMSYFWKRMGNSLPLFLYFCLFNTVDSVQVNVRYKSLPMTGFEPRTSSLGSDRSCNWVTTTAQHELFTFVPSWDKVEIYKTVHTMIGWPHLRNFIWLSTFIGYIWLATFTSSIFGIHILITAYC